MAMKIALAWLPLLALLIVWIVGALFARNRLQRMASHTPSGVSGPMDAITICRKPEGVNYFRRYQIEIDGARVGSLRPGEVGHFPVAPGQHTVTARIDWCRSHPLEVTKANNTNLRLECGASVQNWRCLFEMLFRPRQYVYIAYGA